MRIQIEEGSIEQTASTKALCEVQLCRVDAHQWAKVGHHQTLSNTNAYLQL